MTTQHIRSVGGYLPILRLQRKAAVAALRATGLGGPRDGHRAVAGWDEDAFTLAAEAARAPVAGLEAGTLCFASTSAYFTERSTAALMIDALALPRTVRTQDVSGSRRSGTSALLAALEGRGEAVVAAGERRPTQAGSAQQLLFGDGGAAVRVGDAGPVRFIAGVSMAHDFVDFYVSRDQTTPYAYEERFVKEASVAEIYVPTLRALAEKAGVGLDKVAFAAVAEPLPSVYPAIARKLGLTAPNLASDLLTQAGDLGSAHALFAFGLALDKAQPGDIVLLAGFGSGCDAMLFEVTGTVPGAREMAAFLAEGQELTDYIRFLNLSNALDLAWGMRSEFEQKAQATVLDRHGRDTIGFIGGRDSTGSVQFPKSRIPVNPALDKPETLVDVRLADEQARIVSITADRLNFTPDPPFDFGLVQFDNGARVMMELADRPATGFAVGEAVKMRLRIKAMDRRRGFRTYFWKAVPMERPALEIK